MERKLNYQQTLDITLKKIKSEYDADSKKEKKKLLLHACCAPCSSYVLEYLSNYFDITIYYYNPNIHPQEEYVRRLNELQNFLPEFKIRNNLDDIKLVTTDYNVEDFFSATNTETDKNLQTEKERGERCRRCYYFRMKKTFTYAARNGYDFYTTTLSISPYKDADKINTIGLQLIEELENPGNSPAFLVSDFKKKNGFKRSLELSKEYGLYRQDYCGCIYSKINTENERKHDAGNN